MDRRARVALAVLLPLTGACQRDYFFRNTEREPLGGHVEDPRGREPVKGWIPGLTGAFPGFPWVQPPETLPDLPPPEPRSACDPDDVPYFPPVLLPFGLCPAGGVVAAGEGSLTVSADGASSAVAHLRVPEAGWYHLYGDVPSGARDQHNQSAWLRAPSVDRPFGSPLHTNCDSEWVVPDLDEVAWVPEGALVYLGTFLLRGEAELELRHGCELVRTGACAWPHDTGGGDACDDGSPQPVTLRLDSLCAVPTAGP